MARALYRHMVVWTGLICGLIGPATLNAEARGVPASPPPPAALVRILSRYFADLNAHRYHAAWRLEAACNVSYSISNGPGSPVGSAGFAGRGTWVPPTPHGRHPILAAAHVTAIRPLSVPELQGTPIKAFAVSGWYRFDYTSVPYANDTHRSGFHVVKIAMWPCHGRWGVEPPYWVSAGGGPLNWT